MNQQDKETLEGLNKAVGGAIEARRNWLDSKMTEYADFEIGDCIYDLRTGVNAGTVTKLYRYWRDRSEGVLDRTLDIEYEFQTSPRCLDNTSRQPHRLGTKEQAIKRAESHLSYLNR